MAAKETLERELKLAAPDGFELPDLGGEPLERRTFTSTYYDGRRKAGLAFGAGRLVERQGTRRAEARAALPAAWARLEKRGRRAWA